MVVVRRALCLHALIAPLSVALCTPGCLWAFLSSTKSQRGFISLVQGHHIVWQVPSPARFVSILALPTGSKQPSSFHHHSAEQKCTELQRKPENPDKAVFSTKRS